MARRSGVARVGGALVGLVLVLLLAGAGPVAAQSAPPPDPEGVLTALHIGQVATDYVVLVDLSGSMARSGRYDDVKASLRDLFGRLDPADRVSLVTFADVPTVVARSDPAQARAAVDRLPATPSGTSTDIGAAIEEGFALLERPDADPAGTLLLLTDGEPEPPDGSVYARRDAPAWSALAERGQALAGRVHGIALPLGTGETGAPLLSKALPGTVVLQLQGDDLGRYLVGLPEELRLADARDRIANDLAASVDVRWLPPPGVPDLQAGPVAVDVELRASTTALPLHVDDLAVTASGAAVEVTGLPPSMALGPGAVERLTLHLAPGLVPDGWQLGRRTDTVPVALRLTGRVDTPWRPVVEQDLRAKLDLRPLDATASVLIGVSTGLSWGIAGAAAAVLLVALVLLWLVWNRRHPRLVGVLTVERPDEAKVDIDLAARRSLRIPRVTRPAPDEANGSYVVRGVGRDGGPLVAYRPAHGRVQHRSCAPGEWIDVGGVLFRWDDPPSH